VGDENLFCEKFEIESLILREILGESFSGILRIDLENC
jgi:hypothetical protein